MELKAYGKAASVAEEVFSSIHTVLSYNRQKREETRFDLNNKYSYCCCSTTIYLFYIAMKNIFRKLKEVV
jgi:ABC-type multidrug transport system fused ATPase/permease subunit